MTEHKTQPREQIATHIYRRPEARELSATSVDASTHQRVVTRHREVQPTAGESYVQRRNRLYSARTKAPVHHAPAPRRARTLAQTGVPAVGGLKRPLRAATYASPWVLVEDFRHLCRGRDGDSGCELCSHQQRISRGAGERGRDAQRSPGE